MNGSQIKKDSKAGENCFNKLVTAPCYGEVLPEASPQYHNQLYAKHKDHHPSKIVKGFLPDVVLGTGGRIQPSPYL